MLVAFGLALRSGATVADQFADMSVRFVMFAFKLADLEKHRERVRDTF